MNSHSFSIARLAVALFAAATLVGASAPATHINEARDEVLARHTENAAHGCQSTEFWYSKQNCCIKTGGPGSNPATPANTACPSTHWWRNESSCCVPRTPTAPSIPNCGSNWSWDDKKDCCTPSGPTPSGAYNHHRRAAAAKREVTLCPKNLSACPVSSLTPGGDYECLDTASELESCGGCASIGEGQNCAAIKGAWNFACEKSECRVYSCDAGYKVAADHKSCVPLA